MSRFDQVMDRRDTCCAKWDGHSLWGVPEHALPLWVADMDFAVLPEVTEALARRTTHEIFGYSLPSPTYQASIANWMERRHNWTIDPEWIVTCPGVIPALNVAVHLLTDPGDAVMIQQPVYPPFANVVRENHRRLINNPLILQGSKYAINFTDFEHKIVAHQVKLFILCSPHNPVGRVWSREELRQMGEICLKHNVLIVSDEIHHDFIFAGHKHIPLPAVDPALKDIALVCTAPSKTFNIAGLQAANIIIPNPRLREAFYQKAFSWGVSKVNTMGLIACEAAYTHGDQWLAEAITYVYRNMEYVRDYLRTRLPAIRLIESEGLYLLWLDCRGLGLAHDELEHFLLHQAGLWLNQGYTFGEEGRGFVRLNIACPRSTLVTALNQLEKAVQQVAN